MKIEEKKSSHPAIARNTTSHRITTHVYAIPFHAVHKCARRGLNSYILVDLSI